MIWLPARRRRCVCSRHKQQPSTRAYVTVMIKNKTNTSWHLNMHVCMARKCTMLLFKSGRECLACGCVRVYIYTVQLTLYLQPFCHRKHPLVRPNSQPSSLTTLCRLLPFARWRFVVLFRRSFFFLAPRKRWIGLAFILCGWCGVAHWINTTSAHRNTANKKRGKIYYAIFLVGFFFILVDLVVSRTAICGWTIGQIGRGHFLRGG